jgi:hypothetical protein
MCAKNQMCKYARMIKGMDANIIAYRTRAYVDLRIVADMCVCVCRCNYLGYSVTFRHVITFKEQIQDMNPRNTVDLRTFPLLILSSLQNTVTSFSQTG